jgi:hypothetical protein
VLDRDWKFGDKSVCSSERQERDPQKDIEAPFKDHNSDFLEEEENPLCVQEIRISHRR